MEIVNEVFLKQKAFFNSGKTKDYHYRIESLKKLKAIIKKYEDEILDTLNTELRKPHSESYQTELGVTYEEINITIKNLSKWMKPKRVRTPITHFGASSTIYSDPYGVSLIIAPWNYPIQLSFAPLIGAISGGNCAILKPSELTPKISSLLKKMITEVFEEEYIAVIEGGVEVSTELLQKRFDNIFFTGSVPVGKIVMEAAAKHLTPLTLELGGKSPAIVDQTANIDLAAKRIVWGKFTNAGQTCIAPDYLLVHKSIKEELLDRMNHYIEVFYGEKPLESNRYAAIVTERHAKRLASFIEEAHILRGGAYDIENRYIEPTIIDQISLSDGIMNEEIFGPILPIFEFDQLNESVEFIQQFEKPLALYVFSNDRSVQEQIMKNITFGGGCINDTLMHIASAHLPFGGVGQSGLGSYHGKASFEAFTHQKSVVRQTTLFDLPLRYPNSKNGISIIKKLLK
jgi:aldehyde dehydrogenase (NAD+)